MIRGIGTSKGIGIGHALIIDEPQIEAKTEIVSDTAAELRRYENVKKKFIADTQNIIEELKKKLKKNDKTSLVLQNQIYLIEDIEMNQQITGFIENEHLCADAAVDRTCSLYADIFASLDSEVMNQRVADIEDLKHRILSMLSGNVTVDLSNLEPDTIIVAKQLHPSVTAAMDTKHVVGIIAEKGGETSHAAILARALEIPAVLSVKDACSKIADNESVIVDGEYGEVFLKPIEKTVQIYTKKKKEYQKKVKELYEKEFVPVEQSLLGQGGSLTSIQDRADYVHASVKMDNILWIHNLRSGSPYAGYPNKSYQEYVEDNKQGKYIYWDSKVSYQDIVNWRLDWLSKHKQYLDATYAALNPGEDGIQELTPEVPDDDKTKPDDNKKDDNKKPNTTTAVKPEIIRSIPQTINAIVKATAGNVQISWNKVAGAKGYDVWITKCGSSYKKGVQKTTRKLNTKVSLKKFKKFNLRTGSWKVKVRAYTYVNGKKKVLVTGSNLHFALITSGQYTNAKKISVNKKKVNLKKGGKFKVKAEIIKERKGRKLLPQTHCKSLQWKTTNAKIATVKNGKITAKQKGVCKIYVIAANGVKKRIKVTVN